MTYRLVKLFYLATSLVLLANEGVYPLTQ